MSENMKKQILNKKLELTLQNYGDNILFSIEELGDGESFVVSITEVLSKKVNLDMVFIVDEDNEILIQVGEDGDTIELDNGLDVLWLSICESLIDSFEGQPKFNLRG